MSQLTFELPGGVCGFVWRSAGQLERCAREAGHADGIGHMTANRAAGRSQEQEKEA